MANNSLNEDSPPTDNDSTEELIKNKPSRIWRFALSLDGISISLSKLLDTVTKAGVVFNRLILLGVKIFFCLLLLYTCFWMIINIAELF